MSMYAEKCAKLGDLVTTDSFGPCGLKCKVVRNNYSILANTGYQRQYKYPESVHIGLLA